MADAPVVHVGENSPEEVAFKLLHEVAAAESMEMFADERAVKKMLSKLLSNAIKFSDEKTPISVILDYGADGNCRLSVEDQGIGADPDSLIERHLSTADGRRTRSSWR